MRMYCALGGVSVALAITVGMLDRETRSLAHLLSEPGNLAGLAVWSLFFFAVGVAVKLSAGALRRLAR